jgi:hypothetical protein
MAFRESHDPLSKPELNEQVGHELRSPKTRVHASQVEVFDIAEIGI